MGREFLDDALPVDIEREGVRVTGFAGLPTLHRPDPGQQYLFVNGRPVKDKLLIGAVRAAYGDLLPKGRYPLLALFVALAAARGRRQRAPEQGRGALPRCRRACAAWWPARCGRRWRRPGTGPSATGGAPTPRDAGARVHAAGGIAAVTAIGMRARGRRTRAIARLRRGLQAPLDGLDAPSADAGARRAGARPTCSTGRWARRARSCTRPTSWRRRATSVVIVDQHAAHERLVYERVKAALANGGVARQVLLIPEIVELDADEAAALGRGGRRARRARAWCWRRSGPAR